jgi:serine/threonine protein kinase
VTLSEGCKDLLLRMLQYDPAQRITVPDILQHNWFTEQLSPDLGRLISTREQHLALPSPCALSFVGLQAVIQQMKRRLARP